MRRARRLERFLTQPLFVTKAFTGRTGRHVPLEKTLAGCEAILEQLERQGEITRQVLELIGARFADD
jgi:F-type H+-transporting ATPase subunit beta